MTEDQTTAISPLTQTEEPAPLRTLKQVWGHTVPQGELNSVFFIIDESLPGTLVEAFQGSGDFLGAAFTLTPEQANDALEYWRTKTIEAVDEVAARYRAEIAAHPASHLGPPAE
jgi:hypothetical protein